MALVATRPKHLTQGRLESILKAAANALRGSMDAADFKSYVVPVLFFKWLSDVHDYNHETALEELGDQWTAELEDEDYQHYAIPTGATWQDVRNRTVNRGAKLQEALLAIEETNPALAGIFGDANWANPDRMPDSTVKALLESFAGDEARLDPDHVSGDMLGAAYEYLLRDFAESSGKKAGEFYTPRHVVKLLVSILDPKVGDSVADPACGSAGMLVETIAEVKDAGGNPLSLSLYGQEKNVTTAAMARMNLILHGIEDFQIAQGDTFRQPKLLDRGGLRKFDVVIANPPYSLQNWGADSWASDPYRRALGDVVPPAGNADWAWIQHMLTTMKPGTGRVGVVMPHGALFRGGAEARARQFVVERNLLEAVIGLPANLFYSTPIPVCLLVFRARKEPERDDNVLFIDARTRFVKGKNQNRLSDEDIADIVAAYRTGADTDGESGLALRLVPRNEVEGNDWDLNISRYLAGESKAEANVEEALLALREAQDRLDTSRVALDEALRSAGFDA